MEAEDARFKSAHLLSQEPVGNEKACGRHDFALAIAFKRVRALVNLQRALGTLSSQIDEDVSKKPDFVSN